MRAGANCAAQQTLSAEAASVLKHSLSLSRRRGHAQVTPLHVAATLLMSSRASILRRACLKSQPHQPSHPLQCRALELCFNVALNRLPATPAPLLHAQPSLSNALVAALKRAQAHQRRGCVEQQQHQQQPLITIKVELEQLILSILDDPSVSRVMREAGFSSTAVKNNLEDSSSVSSVFQCYNTSGGIYSTPNSPPTENPSRSFWPHSHLLSYASSDKNPFLFSPQKKPVITDAASSSSFKEDIKVVFEVLVKKRRNTVIVGDSLSMVEGFVSELMSKVERGDVPDELKSARFIKFQFSSVPLRFMNREEVEINIADLKRKVDSFIAVSSGGGVFIYTGDLKWAVVDDDDENGASVYSPVDHLVAEMGKLLSWYNNNRCNTGTRVLLVATANYQTYMKLQMKDPPLDGHWNVQAVSVPSSGGLGLSLNAAAAATSGLDSKTDFPHNPSHDLDKKPFCIKEEQDHLLLTCCPECTSNYDREAGNFKSFSSNSINKETENGSPQLPFWLKKPHSIDMLDKDYVVELRRKYNKLCQSLHQGSNQCYNYTSSYPSWTNKNSIYANDSETISFAYPKFNQTASSLPRFRRQQSCHIDFTFSNNESSKVQTVEPNLDSLKGVDDKEVKITLALGNSTYTYPPTSYKVASHADLCDQFQENVPWQSETIPLIVEALADSKSMNRDMFILIEGNDFVGKRRFAVGIAKFMFCSSDLLFCMSARKSSNNREMLEKVLRNHENIVVLVEDVDCADREFAEFLDERYENGELETERMHDKKDHNGHAIFILSTMDGNTSYDKLDKDVDYVIQMKLVINESKLGPDKPNHESKRKAEWDFPIIRSKSQRSNMTEDRNALDLNIEADEDEVKIDDTIIQRKSLSFFEKIKSRFVLNRNSDQEKRAREMFLSKFRQSFKDVTSGSGNMTSFKVEEMVLEEILRGSGLYLNSLFDRWLKEVFETSLRTVDSGDKRERVISIRLCLGGKGENCPEDGFMGTCLPKSVSVSSTG